MGARPLVAQHDTLAELAVLDPLAQAQLINTFLGDRLDVLAMAEQVDPGLYRNRQKG